MASDIAHCQEAEGPNLNHLTVVEKPAQWDRLKQLLLDNLAPGTRAQPFEILQS